LGSTMDSRFVPGRNKTFFFVSYEGLRLIQPQAASLQYVLITTCGRFQYRQLSSKFSMRSPCKLRPQRYRLRDASSPSLATFQKSYSLPGQIDSTSIRADHTLNQRATIFFRYAYTPSDTSLRGLSRVTTNHINADTYTLGATNHLTNALSNELRIGYGLNNAFLKSSLDSFNGAVPMDLLSAWASAATHLELPSLSFTTQYRYGIYLFIGIGRAFNKAGNGTLQIRALV